MSETPERRLYKELLSACVNGYMKRELYKNVEIFYWKEQVYISHDNVVFMDKTVSFAKRFEDIERRFVKDPNNPSLKLELDRLWVKFNHYNKSR